MKYAIFTVCMPELSIEDAAAALAKIGYDGVEWRVTAAPQPGQPVVNYWSGNRCTVDEATIGTSIKTAIAACKKNKLAIPALGTYLHYSTPDRVEACMAAAAEAGAKSIRVGVDGYKGDTHFETLFKKAVKGYAKIEKLARKYRVKACPEIHMGLITPSCSSMRRFVEHFDPKYVGVIHDAGNMRYEGFENWKMGLEILGPYLTHVHVKNAACRISGAMKDTTLQWSTDAAAMNKGLVNWHDVFTALKAVGYNGWLSLEDFSSEQPTIEKLTFDLAYLKGIEKAVFGPAKKK